MEAARPATPGDLPRLVDLSRMARDELAPMRGGELLIAREGQRGDLDTSLAADLDDPERGVWVGTIDSTVVGYGVGHVESLAGLDDGAPGRLGVIDDLFVEPDARSVGVGEAMMAMMLGWFAARACRGVDALALPGNRSTKNFFEESGFTARLLVMHHRLDG
jgi:ribosomal protein S18 acetylase RimI-like enzyme